MPWHNETPSRWTERFQGSKITAEQARFGAAIERYKRLANRPFPTWLEVLNVARDLGYRKMALARYEPDIPSAALANRSALEAATAATDLPAGTIYTDKSAVLTQANTGLTLRGPESSLKSLAETGDYIDRAALAIRAGADGKAVFSWRGDEVGEGRGPVLPGQVGWHFDGDDSKAQPSFSARRIMPGEPVPQDFEFMRAWSAVPFNIGKYEFPLPEGHGLTLNEIVMATDGPMINEPRGEWRRIVAATPHTVTLDRPLRDTYRQGVFVRGAFPSRMTFRGMKLQGAWGTVFVQQSCDVVLADVTIPPASDPNANGTHSERASLATCSRVELRRCMMPGLSISTSNHVRLIDCRSPNITGEQGTTDVTIDRGVFGWLDTRQGCDRWTIDWAEFTDEGSGRRPDCSLAVYDGWMVRNVIASGLVRVRGYRATVSGLKTTGPMIVQHDYAGGNALSATKLLITDIDAAYIELLPGTSGMLSNVRCPVVCRDPATRANWTKDGRPLP